MNELKEKAIAELTLELWNDVDFNAEILNNKVENAIQEIRLRRNYEAVGYTEEQIEKDMKQFYPNIVSVARYDYNTLGAEGQQSHSENGIARTWVSRNRCFTRVVPLSCVC